MSIHDSNWCWLSRDVTVLAGKNESGKTALLKGFNAILSATKMGDIATLDRRIDEPERPPRLHLAFAMTKDEIQDIEKQLEAKLSENIKHRWMTDGVEVVFGENWVKLGEIDSGGLHALADAKLSGAADEINAALDAVIKAMGANVVLPKSVTKEAFERTLSSINALGPNVTAQHAGDLQMIDGLIKVLPDPLARRCSLLLWSRRPVTTYFNEFSAEIPFEIPLVDAEKYPAIVDIAKLAGIDLNYVKTEQNLQGLKNYLSKRSARISGDFAGFYSQDSIELDLSVNGDKLLVGIREAGSTDTFRFEQRSRGLQWFVAFYSRVQSLPDGPKVLLIDEPGLYLHARAQRDILKVMGHEAASAQVVFSTHSPYLIDVDRLDRIRLVSKGAQGTAVQDKFHKGADLDALTPIITAIGLEVAHDFAFAKKRNCVVEGPTEAFVFSAMRSLLKVEDLSHVAWIPAMGATKVSTIIGLLFGWGLSYCAVLDNDAEGRREYRRLVADYPAAEDAPILLVAEKGDVSTEDLFSKQDFVALYLGDATIPVPSKNSQYFAENAAEKVLTARKFAERVRLGAIGEPDVSAETRANFAAVFKLVAIKLNAFQEE
jgi:predicted ATPase